MALRRASTRSCRSRETEDVPQEETQNTGATKRKRQRQTQAQGGQKRGLKADRHAQLDENVRLPSCLCESLSGLCRPCVASSLHRSGVHWGAEGGLAWDVQFKTAVVISHPTGVVCTTPMTINTLFTLFSQQNQRTRRELPARQSSWEMFLQSMLPYSDASCCIVLASAESTFDASSCGCRPCCSSSPSVFIAVVPLCYSRL